tara:strand:+ start:637 stop:3516 length:2880 start_codon:yes stop_codon:yes gene_type:complete
MNSSKKINKLKSITYSELAELVKTLFKSLGYYDLNSKNERCITGSIKTGITTSIHGFILYKEAFTGSNANLNSFIGVIKSNADKYDFHTCYLINTENISSGFKGKVNVKYNYEYLDRDKLILLIDEHLPNFWNHSDLELLEYEKYFLNNIAKDDELKRLKISEKTYDKLLGIFIEPRIYQLKEDKESVHPVLEKFDSKKILEIKTPAIIAGDTGAGKSTFLRKIGETCINEAVPNKKKRIPIFISTVDLITCDYEILKSVNKNLNGFYEGNYKKALETCDILILVDSIDEFERKIQKRILVELEGLFNNYRINYFIGTRHIDNGFNEHINQEMSYFNIEKFNDHQIKNFISKFFPTGSRADNLINALKENRILERLPITPLSISLISILFEEKNFEIPATISDIYDNFNLLLLGKTNVESRFEFIDINFKERILSLYALKVMSTENKIPLTKDEFLKFFNEYFKNKTQPLPENKLEEFLIFLIENTGILFLKNGKYVQFKHDSFMEYYCAIEIFKHERDQEDLLVENFFDPNWQNSAIFYAGKSRDMPKFLGKITTKVKTANNLNNYFAGVMGIGYLLQALYQTDNILRKDSLLTALNINIKSYELLTKIASDEQMVSFKNMKLPFIAMINMFFFFENFNSVTIKTPLGLAFDDVYNDYEKDTFNVTNGYKALKLAVTLNSTRINSDKQLEKLVYNSSFLKTPLLLLLADIGVSLFKGNNYNELKKEISKNINGRNKVAQLLLDTPAKKLRFTGLDQIRSNRKVNIYTEGKSDVEIIEHAYMKLTENSDPYWSIKSCGNTTGGATELHGMLMKCAPMVKEDEVVIGVFDNDAKGIQEFNGLKKGVYKLIEGSKRVKKHISKNIYAIKLPIPPFRNQYLVDDQVFNYFCVEHYFEDSLLLKEGMVKATLLPEIFEINDKKKKKFSEAIRKLNDAEIFKNFKFLFDQIDDLSGIDKIDYEY